MSWVPRNGVQVWDGATPFPEPGLASLSPYRHCAAPLELRPRPSCGKPGTGRAQHQKHGEPACDLCREAEREYAQRRRERAAS